MKNILESFSYAFGEPKVMSTPKMKFALGTTALLAVLLFFGIFTSAHASEVINDDFESYSVSALNGQGNWSSSGSADVINGSTVTCEDGTQCGRMQGGDFGNSYTYGTTLMTGHVSFWFYVPSAWATGGNIDMQFQNSADFGWWDYTVQFENGSGGTRIRVFSTYPSRATAFDGLAYGQWHSVDVAFDINTCTFTVDVDSSGTPYPVADSGNSNTICTGHIAPLGGVNSFVFSGGINSGGGGGNFYFDSFGTGSFIGPIDTRTRIDTVQPTPDSVNATSSPITYGATGYVNEEDFTDDTYLRVRIAPLTANLPGGGTQNVGILDFAKEFTLDIGSIGSFDVSATTSLPNFGGYTALYELHSKSYCLLGFCLVDNVLVATSTTFTMGTTTVLDQIARNNLAYLNQINTASSTVDTSCYFANLGQ